MTGKHRRSRIMRYAALAVAATSAAAVGMVMSAPSGSAGPAGLAGPFYNSPDQNVDRWVKANPNDSRTPAIKRIAGQPAAVWIGGWSRRADVTAASTAAAANGTTPVFVFYNIPERDCGGYSGGGAPSLAAYDAWVRDMAAGLGNRQAVVILEPDAIGHQCGGSGRLASLSRAGASIHQANAQARVYYDAGHFGWKVNTDRLKQAGVTVHGDGIFTNVSNFNTTVSEVSYAKGVLAALGDADLRAVVDTSRNGAGPAAGGAWCNPPGRKIGRNPTTVTGDAKIDAFLWVKLAGESDGACNGNPPAGTFSPALAYALASGAPASPADPTPTPTPTTRPPSPTPTPTVTATGCAAPR